MGSYAGDMTPNDVWNVLASGRGALVDVRTSREWEVVGTPDIGNTGRPCLYAQWQVFPTMAVDPDFAEKLDSELTAAGIARDEPVFFLCRSGVRSQGAAAAMTAMGWTQAINISNGFEGMPDGAGERGKVNGWQHDGLAWSRN